MGVSHNVSTCSCMHAPRKETSERLDRLFPCRYNTAKWVNPLQKALPGKAQICGHRSKLAEQIRKSTKISTVRTYASIRTCSSRKTCFNNCKNV